MSRIIVTHQNLILPLPDPPAYRTRREAAPRGRKARGVFRAACGAAASMLLAFSFLAPAAAEPATLLGGFSNWSAYQTGSGDSLTCYALSQPRASQPRSAKRDPVYVIVSDWPGRKTRAEVQVVLGYQAKEGAPASFAVGGDKFAFFMRNEGKAGKAWLQSLSDGERLIEAMKSGVSAVAMGTSRRGTKTVDTYSLAGFADALAKIHDACKM